MFRHSMVVGELGVRWKFVGGASSAMAQEPCDAVIAGGCEYEARVQ